MGSNQVTAKLQNIRSILKGLLQYRQISRIELANLTGLTTATITNLVNELINQGIAREEGVGKSVSPRVGRPRMVLELIPTARYAIGVHIGIGEFHIVITDLLANIHQTISIQYEICSNPEIVVLDMGDQINKLIQLSRIPIDAIIGVGIGASGLVNVETGMNVNAPNLCWRDVPIRDWVRQKTGLPVVVDNNVRLMCLAESMFGIGKHVHSMAFIYARIGVGAGLVVNDNLYRGMAAGAGEIGHSIIIPDGGELCRCGNHGCLETLVSEPAIIRLAHQIAQANPQGILAKELQNESLNPMEQIFSAAKTGDPEVLNMLKERSRYFGIALANLINILNPEMIVLGGLLAYGEASMLSEIQNTVKQCAFSHLGDAVQIRITSFGQKAGMIGAAALALNTFFYDFTNPADQEKLI
jgi:glucokinase-like ROK family protein